MALNGEDYTDGGKMFAYYRHPVLEAVSPNRGSAAKSQLLTVTRSTAVASGAWAPSHLVAPPTYLCRFDTIVDPDGHRQAASPNPWPHTPAAHLSGPSALRGQPTASFYATDLRQVTFSNTTAATVVDATELQCRTPQVDFLGPVHVEVTLNGAASDVRSPAP